MLVLLRIRTIVNKTVIPPPGIPRKALASMSVRVCARNRIVLHIAVQVQCLRIAHHRIWDRQAGN